MVFRVRLLFLLPTPSAVELPAGMHETIVPIRQFVSENPSRTSPSRGVDMPHLGPFHALAIVLDLSSRNFVDQHAR